MLTFKDWLTLKSTEFANKTYLVDSTRQITYAENFNTIQKLTGQLQDLPKKEYVVFLGASSIEAYQLYFTVIALHTVWVPIDYRLNINSLTAILDQLNPALIIYDDEGSSSIQNLSSKVKAWKCLHLADIFNNLNNAKTIEIAEEKESNRIISAYLTSGSTGLPKVVLHGWEATLYHAHATVERYQLTAESRLFNPRHIFHASGAFPLTTLMHCGGSITIPNSASLKKSPELCQIDWAELMLQANVTHASFFPREMRRYAELISKQPKLTPTSLQRITTGGEPIELSDLIEVSRAFAAHRTFYDYLWMLHPYLGDGKLFTFFKLLYEQRYGRLVQVTQTYGATELICNAIANTPISGPDTRGIGSAMNSVHPEIIDEQGMVLPSDGKAIGRLRFFGNSIASGYLGYANKALTPHCYATDDLASIAPNGEPITFFGRVENLIQLPGEKYKINPIILEREIKKITYAQTVIIFKHKEKLHAALRVPTGTNESTVIQALKNNKACALVTTISLWNEFPVLAEGGKTDRQSLITKVENGEKAIVSLNKWQPSADTNRFKFCLIL